MQLTQAAFQTPSVRLLQVMGQQANAPWKLWLVESYLRGSDCVASYAPTPPDQVQPQIYWRGISAAQGSLGGMEMLLSMQTSLLDSDPTIALKSELPAGEQWSWNSQNWDSLSEKSVGLSRSDAQNSATGLLLLRPTQSDTSYAQAVFPSDFLQAEAISTPQTVTWSYPMFGERLEKGVIRRGRIAGWLLPRDNDQKLALTAWQAFCASPPPLTT